MKQFVRGALLVVGLLLGGTAQAGKVTYVYTDIQGTPVMESDAQGHITARYDYTPYGVPVQGLSGAPDGPGYTGHVNDPDTGFVYMQARYYDPVVGRFLSIDPIDKVAGDSFSFNRFSYVNDNPMAHVDPTGMACGGNGEVSKDVQKMRDIADGCSNSGSSAREVTAEISPVKSWYHIYGGPGAGDWPVCKETDPWCTAPNAFEALKHFAFPGQDPEKAVVNGQVGEISFLGISGGHIQTFVDNRSLSIINVTLPDHLFFNGYVVRSVVVKGSVINIRTFGEGNNTNYIYEILNRATWRPGFYPNNEPLRFRMVQRWLKDQ